jgi:hypothetical protein
MLLKVIDAVGEVWAGRGVGVTFAIPDVLAEGDSVATSVIEAEGEAPGEVDLTTNIFVGSGLLGPEVMIRAPAAMSSRTQIAPKTIDKFRQALSSNLPSSSGAAVNPCDEHRERYALLAFVEGEGHRRIEAGA